MPQHSPEPPTLDPADVAACRALLRHGSHSFHHASRLLPPRVRDAATALYAFCRVADDAIDLGDDRDAALQGLRRRLDAIYAQNPADDPVDRAMAAIVVRHEIPRELPEALLEGMAWDAAGCTYADRSEMYAYAARVAGSVGAMMALLMGVRDAATLARACELGVAMQLTNIARDVGEDARAGRLYLPRAWLAEAGIDPDDWLAEPAHGPRLAGVIRHQLDTAEGLYTRATSGIAALPLGCRIGIRAARLIYADIGREIAAAGYDSVGRRAVVPGRRKAGLLARAVAGPGGTGGRLPEAAPGPAETQFLVDAAARATPRAAPPAGPAWWDLRGRLVWTLELFMRLEQRGRLDTAARAASK